MKCQLQPVECLLLICSALQCVSAVYYSHDESLFSVPEVPAVIGEDAVITCYKLTPDLDYSCTPAIDNTTCRITFYHGNGSQIVDSNPKYEIFHSTTERTDNYCKFSNYSFATVLLHHEDNNRFPCFYSTLTIKNVTSQDLGEYECRWPRSYEPLELLGVPVLDDWYTALNTTVDLYDASDDSVAITASLIYQSEGENFAQFVYTSTEGAKDMKIQWGEFTNFTNDLGDLSEIDEYMIPKEINSTYISNGFVHEAYFYISEHHWLDKDLIIYCGDYKATLNAPNHPFSRSAWSYVFMVIFIIFAVVSCMVVILIVTCVLAAVRGNVCSCCKRGQNHTAY